MGHRVTMVAAGWLGMVLLAFALAYLLGTRGSDPVRARAVAQPASPSRSMSELPAAPASVPQLSLAPAIPGPPARRRKRESRTRRVSATRPRAIATPAPTAAPTPAPRSPAPVAVATPAPVAQASTA